MARKSKHSFAVRQQQQQQSYGSSSSGCRVDPKLFHLVKKYVPTSSSAAGADPEYVANRIVTQHREYARKDANWLVRNVQLALEQMMLSTSGEDTATPTPRRNKKRPLAFGSATRNTTSVDDAQYLEHLSALVGDYATDYLENQKDDEDGTTIFDYVLDLILDRHADQFPGTTTEYLSGQIRQILHESKSSNSSIQSRKRSLPHVDDDDDNDDPQDLQYEREAQEEEARREQVPSASLNDTVVRKIRTDQKEREQLAAAESKRLKKLKQKQKKVKKLRAGNSNSSTGESDIESFLVTERPKERYTDLGGMDGIIQEIRQLVEYPLVRPELYRHLGVDPPRGVLLRGPPGCGKTALCNAIAGQLVGVSYFRVSAPELVSGMSGESEQRIRSLFTAASDMAPSIIFLDEIDAVAPKRSDGQRGMEKRMVAQLLTCMDMVHPQYNQNGATVVVLAATNRPDALDPALRRAGRFDKEILLGVPDEDARRSILKTMTENMRLMDRTNFDFQELARKTPGYVGADVRSLIKEAAVIAINRIFRDVLTDDIVTAGVMALTNGVNSGTSGDDPMQEEEEDDNEGGQTQVSSWSEVDLSLITPLSPERMESLYITMEDFLQAIPLVQPSSKREGFATVPGISWDEIGALSRIREELTLSVLAPIRHPEHFQALGLSLPAGVLLYGPPGCGKTLLAKAIANESGANFLSVKGPELLDKYVGESERAVRVVFERARSSSPCIVFFDELDSLCPKRGSDSSGGGGVSERVVNQLLTEMDGLESRRSVFVIAATNRPELIDPAMLRPGRLDKLLYVPLPTPDDRVSILKAISGKVQLAQDVDLDAIGRSHKADGYSGADCAALLREAGLAVLRQSIGNTMDSVGDMKIHSKHFDYAFDHVMPSVSKKDQSRYDKMRQRMARARSRATNTEFSASPSKEADDASV